MNLINFPKKYIRENQCSIIGQGLMSSWRVLLYGNGFNKYIFTVMYNDKEYKIYIDEKHIIEWKIREKYEEEDSEVDSVNFQAYGNFNNIGYYNILSWDFDDFDHLFIKNHKLKIIDIIVENDRPDVPLIGNIYDDYKFIDNINARYRDISNIGFPTYTDVQLIEYSDFINAHDSSRMYYLYSSRGDIYPFNVIKIDKLDEEECKCTAKIYYDKTDKIKDESEFTNTVEIKMVYYEDPDNEFNIGAEFKVMNDIFGDVYIDFDEDCCIKI